MVVAPMLVNATDLVADLMLTSSSYKPIIPRAQFYGYRNAADGNGDAIFDDLLAKAKESHMPLVVVWSNAGCSYCDQFAAACSADDGVGGRYFRKWMSSIISSYKCIFSYFKGSGDVASLAPRPCKQAYEFCYNPDSATPWPLYACYWVHEDGSVHKECGKLTPTVYAFESIVTSFMNRHKPPPTPPYVPPKASAGFAVRNGDLTVAPGAEQVYVPFIRTNNFDAAESNWLVAEYPAGAVETNAFLWAGNKESYKEVSLALGGRLAKAGDRAVLVLLNTNQVVVASNSVACVAAPVNSASNPYLPGAVTALPPGEWSVDAGLIDASSNDVAALRGDASAAIAAYDAATNALSIATAAYDAATNALFYAGETNALATAAYDVATNELVSATTAYIAASNALEAAEQGTPEYADALAAFIAASNTLYYADVTNALAAAAYVDATNGLAIATAAYESATNELVAAQGDADEKTGAKNEAAAALEDAEGRFFLVVVGGIVWDGGLIALNRDVFAKPEFGEWCESNRVAAIYLDETEPGTGASLYSYGAASNGLSGASFVSLNGLGAAQCTALADSAAEAAAKFVSGARGACPFQIALVRADGSTGGFLRPQYNADGSCDLAENMARLGELAANAADLDESANDDPAGAAGLVAAGTRDACPYPDDAGDGVIATGTLAVNDMIDCFQLVGDGWTGRKVVFAVTAEGEVSDLAWPGVSVLRYDATSGECVALDGELSVFATNGVRGAEIVYAFSREDIDAGRIFVAATAYGDDDATATKFGGKSAFAYAVSAYEATPNSGIITFDEQPETAIIQETTNQVFNVPLYRLFGSDGELSVGVAIDETLTTATGRYEFVSTDLVWTNGETGVKYVPVTLKGSEYNDGLYDITLRIKEIEAMAGVEKYYTTYTISYGKEPAEEGQIAVVGVAPAAREDGRIYVRYGASSNGSLRTEDEISINVNRTGGKGPAAAYINWKNGKDTARETLSWANYLTGTQTAFLDKGFPALGKSGFVDVTVTVTSSNSVPVVKEGATLKVRVVPYDAPLFDDASVTWSGVQYTTTETNLTALAVPAGMTVKSLVKVSGTLPRGLKVALVDGQLVVTGTPTEGTVASTAVYWVSLERDGGGTLYSMPVTVTFENRALADVNPGFTSSRSWTGLPVTNDCRLAGLLDLSVAKNGRTSARYRMAGGKTVAFSAKGLAGVDSDGSVRLKAEKNSCCGAKYVIDATLCADGSLDATIRLAGGCNEEILGVVNISAGAEPWSAGNTAARFGGDYVAAFVLGATTNENTLCFGSPTMRLKFSSESAWKRGAVTFAGTLPNGKAVSGTAYLLPTTADATSATLPVFASSSSDTLSAMLDVDGEGAVATQGVAPFWSHCESGIESLSYENDYDVVAALWSWDAWKSAASSGAKVSSDGTSGTINKTSGIAAGTMRRDVSGTGRLSTLSWKGVALQADVPSVIGACWYNVSMPYIDAKGNERKRTVKAGDAVGLAIE